MITTFELDVIIDIEEKIIAVNELTESMKTLNNAVIEVGKSIEKLNKISIIPRVETRK